MRETTIALGFDDSGLQGEVFHFLDRLPGASIVGVSETGGALRRLVRDQRPDAIVGLPHLMRPVDHAAKLVVAGRESTELLREAVRARARGFFVWPHEREALARELQRLRPVVDGEPAARGIAIAVLAARGGAGATFLATNLAAAIACRGASTLLADLDLTYGDVAPALGIAPDATQPSVLDLAAISGEVTSDHIDRVVHQHADGFHVLLAPDSAAPSRVDAQAVAALVRALQHRFAVVVLHLPRSLDDLSRAVIEGSDVVLVLVTQDVVGIRAAKRLVDHLRGEGLGESLRLVVNRAGRGEVVPEDARDILDLPLASVIRLDRRVERAQNRGELVVGTKGHVSRRISGLAAALLERNVA